jgi:hypothetical protein
VQVKDRRAGRARGVTLASLLRHVGEKGWWNGVAVIKPLAKHTRSKSNSTRHVRDLLRLAVVSRAFSVRGGALPSEAELMIEVDATRNVVRDALNLLRDEGLIERLPGAGTFRGRRCWAT